MTNDSDTGENLLMQILQSKHTLRYVGRGTHKSNESFNNECNIIQ